MCFCARWILYLVVLWYIIYFLFINMTYVVVGMLRLSLFFQESVRWFDCFKFCYIIKFQAHFRLNSTYIFVSLVTLPHEHCRVPCLFSKYKGPRIVMVLAQSLWNVIDCATIKLFNVSVLTLKVLVATIDALGHFIRIITAQWEGVGDVGSARYDQHYFSHARP